MSHAKRLARGASPRFGWLAEVFRKHGEAAHSRCFASSMADARDMPLLRSLTAALGWRCYRHGAPNGAFGQHLLDREVMTQDGIGMRNHACNFSAPPI